MASLSCSLKTKVKRNWRASRYHRAYKEGKSFTDKLDDAMQMDDDLSMKLDDAQKQAKKICLDLKKAN